MPDVLQPPDRHEVARGPRRRHRQLDGPLRRGGAAQLAALLQLVQRLVVGRQPRDERVVGQRRLRVRLLRGGTERVVAAPGPQARVDAAAAQAGDAQQQERGDHAHGEAGLSAKHN